MGLGKTVITLTAISDLMDDFLIDRTLVIAPLRVANTVWKQEAANWEHLQHLKIVICTGSPAERKAALKTDADIHIINKENVPWLIKNFRWKWNMVVIDESSGFKSTKAKRFRALKKKLKFLDAIVLLTGTPAPQSMIDLWSQIFLIDMGERLGRTITGYRQRFFKTFGYMGYQYKIKEFADKKIRKLIKDICISMKAEDYLDLPNKIYLKEFIEMPKKVKAQYKELKKEFILNLKKDVNIESPSAASLLNKLLQICNGAVYDADGNTHELHSSKIERLKEIVEDNPNENFFVAYNFKSDLKRLKKAFPDAVVLSRSGEELKKWNKGRIKMLLAHPASAGHGLNAQYGGSVIIWFGLNWSLELYQQFNARIHRQGQTKPVRIIHIVAKGGVDEKILKALDSKAENQDELIEYLRFELI
jgi:SNF2 family DNA or RNA helicase